MTQLLSRDLVVHIASLARIELDDEEIAHFTEHLGKILDHVTQLEALDLESVPPMSHPYPLSNVLRDAVAGPTVAREEILTQAPDSSDGQFRVPPVLGESL